MAMANMEEREELQAIIERACQGDRAAFEALIGMHQERLRTVVFFRLGDHSPEGLAIEDVLQETCLRALGALDRFTAQGEDSFFAWLRGIAERVILEAAGREKRRSAAPLESGIAASATSVSRALEREERFSRLQEALRKLSPDHRRVIVLARLKKMPIKDIAALMNRSPDAVTNLLARAQARLREFFGDTESLHLPDRTLDDWTGAKPER